MAAGASQSVTDGVTASRISWQIWDRVHRRKAWIVSIQMVIIALKTADGQLGKSKE